MAKFLFVNQYYWPDFASTGQHLTDLCEHLVRQGHQVRVLCSRGSYLEGRGRASLREERGGVEIVRLPATSFGKGRAVGRLVDYLSFHVLVGLRLLFGPRVDVVVTLTTPPLLGVWGALSRRLRAVRHVNFVMDLHPDAEFELGLLRRESLLGRLLEGANAWPMRSAHANVVLGSTMGERLLAKGVDPTRMVEIPIWSDGVEVVPVPHGENGLRRELGWQDRFVVMYSGNAGLVHRFEELLEAMATLDRTSPRVLFAFVGKGPRTPELQAFVEQRGLRNTVFLPYFPREELRFSLSAADVHFLSLRPEQAGVAVPGKLYGIFAAGRGALFVGPDACESAESVRDSGAGQVFLPGEGAALTERIRALSEAPGEAEHWGRMARVWFEAHHERTLVCERWRALLEEIAATGVPGTPPTRTRAGVAEGSWKKTGT